MKANRFIPQALVAGMILGGSVPATMAAQITASSTDNNIAIPDNDLNGIASTINISSSIQSISSITLSLNVAGGYNGDYYAYLTDGSAIAILLNRTGVSGTNPDGYGNSGFNLIFSDTAANGNIHFYQNVAGYSLNGNGQLTGTWQPDGRPIPPTSSGSDIAASPTTANLDSFDGLNPNGDWTLFIADVSPLNSGSLVDWSLTINGDTGIVAAAPDSTDTLAILCGALGVTWMAARRQKLRML